MTTGMRSAPHEFANTDRDWMVGARCRREDPELFFTYVAEQIEDAKVVCARCPVLKQCRAYALDNRIPSGIWAGLTEKQRRAIWAWRDGKQA